MTSTDRLAEMAAEIERLRARNDELEITLKARDLAAWDEIRHLRARVAELEALVTVGHGTMGTLTPEEPVTITHGHTPNAPPHDE